MIDSKEQIANEVVNAMVAHYPDTDYRYLENVVYFKLQQYDVTPKSQQLVEYEGTSNEELIQRFIISKKVNGCTNATLKNYASSLSLLDREMNHIPFSKITLDDMRIYFAKKQVEGNASMVCLDNYRRNFSSFWEWGTDEQIFDYNIIHKIGRFKVPKEKKKAFSDSEIEKLRAGARSHDNARDIALIETMLCTGARVSEICDMNLEHCDEDAFYILGKGQKYRNIYISDGCKYAIQKYMEERQDCNSPWLWLSSRKAHAYLNKPLTSSGVELMVRKLGKEVGVEDCHPHRFRRTMATNALRHGATVAEVSQMLGHSNVATTQIYLDIDEDDIRQAHKKYVI